MRLIFFSLVAANLALAAWGLFLKSPSESSAGTASSAVATRSSGPKIVGQGAEPVAGGGSGVGVQGPKLCELVGPFGDESSAADFVNRLASIDVASTVQTVELPAGSSFWVHLAPEESRDAAFRRLGELQSQSIESYVIGSGELENAVSLGVFTVEHLADSHMEKLVSFGLDPIKTEFERKELELWVEIQPLDAEKMSDLTWSRLMEGLSSQERRQNFCLPVAS